MGYQALLGIIDAEYEAIRDYDEDALITYLVESFNADAEIARRALVTYGLIDEE